MASAKCILVTGSIWEWFNRNSRVVKSQSLPGRCRALQVHQWAPVSTGDKSGSTDCGHGSRWKHRRQAWEHEPQIWEQVESLWSSLGKTSSLVMLLVHLAITHITYHLMVVKTYLFSLYLHLGICVSIYQLMYTCYIWTGCRRCIKASRGSLEDDNQVNSEIHSEGHHWAFVGMQLDTEIKLPQRFTWRPWSCNFGDAIGDWNWVNWEMHSEAVIEWVWTCTRMLRSSKLREALGGCDRANFEMQLQTEIQSTQIYTGRPWSRKFRDTLGGSDWARLDDYYGGGRSAGSRSGGRWWAASWELSLNSLVS